MATDSDTKAPRSALDSASPNKEKAGFGQPLVDREEAEEEGGGEERRHEPDARERAVENIKRLRARESSGEAEEAEDETEAEGEKSEEKAKDRPAAATGAADGDEEDSDDGVEITVFGKKEKVSRNELIKRAQKASAADIRLNEATALIQELRRREAQRAAAQPRQTGNQSSGGVNGASAPPATPTETARPAAPVLSQDEADKIARALQLGSEEEARTAVQELFDRAVNQAKQSFGGSNTSPSPADGRDQSLAPTTHGRSGNDDVGAMVDARLRAYAETQSLQNDVNRVASEFPDIVNDVGLTHIAVIETHRLRAEDLLNSGEFVPETVKQLEAYARADPRYAQLLADHHRNLERRGLGRNRLELFREAANNARSRYRIAGAGDGPEVTQANEESKTAKTEQKRKLPSQPKASARRSSPPPAPTREERNRSYVKKLMADRGAIVREQKAAEDQH